MLHGPICTLTWAPQSYHLASGPYFVLAYPRKCITVQETDPERDSCQLLPSPGSKVSRLWWHSQPSTNCLPFLLQFCIDLEVSVTKLGTQGLGRSKWLAMPQHLPHTPLTASL